MSNVKYEVRGLLHSDRAGKFTASLWRIEDRAERLVATLSCGGLEESVDVVYEDKKTLKFRPVEFRVYDTYNEILVNTVGSEEESLFNDYVIANWEMVRSQYRLSPVPNALDMVDELIARLVERLGNDADLEKMREYRRRKFGVKVENMRVDDAIFLDEKSVSITYNGSQQMTFGLNEEEAKKVIKALMASYEIDKFDL